MKTTKQRITAVEFYALCGDLELYPSIVLECDAVREAIDSGANYDELREILENNF